MSTFQPGLEPPDDWRHQPPPPTPGPTTTRAASMVWLCSAMGMLMSSCCVCFGVFMVILPQDELMRQLPPDLPNRGQVVEALPMLPTLGVVMAIVGVVMMLIPAIVLAVLGFKVKQGRRGEMIAAIVLLGILGLPLAVALLLSLTSLVTVPSIAGFFVILVEAGCVLIVAGAIISLVKALAEQRTDPGHSSGVEPWSQ